jgi:hypothetical protein
MQGLWGLLMKRKSAREVVALLAPIGIAAAGGIWAVVTYVWPASETNHDPRPTAVCADQGIVIGGSVSGSKIINRASGGSPNPGPCVTTGNK